MTPTIALDKQKPTNLKSLVDLTEKFPSLDNNEVDFEWKKICYEFDEHEQSQLVAEDIGVFWHKLSNKKNFNDDLIFPSISKLAKYCLIIPHSNAETERVFSIVNDVKTKKRNKLANEAINSICILRSSISCCENFAVSAKHKSLMQANNLYSSEI